MSVQGIKFLILIIYIYIIYIIYKSNNYIEICKKIEIKKRIEIIYSHKISLYDVFDIIYAVI